MSRPLFRVLAFGLMLLLPVQGMAAVVAGQCMMFGHHQDSAAQDHHQHAHDDADGHDPHVAHKHADEGQKKSHCGPCTACCASAFIAAAHWPLILPAPSDTGYFFAQFPPLGVQPDGLFRPPLAL